MRTVFVGSTLAIACGVGLLSGAASTALYQTSRPLVRSQLVWFDRAGKRSAVLGSIADYGDLELSPDGKRLAVAVLDAAQGTRDIWLYDVSTGRRTMFTSNSADENWSLWAPDGHHVVFNSQRNGHLDLYQASSTQSNGRKDEVLLSDDAPKWPVSWSSDGKYILYVIDHPETGNDIWVLPLSTRRPSDRRKPFPYLQSPYAENWAAFSPDGRWVAYSSTESSGRPEVYVASFPTPDRRWKISSNGGSQARWRRDGRELFYIALDRTLMAASVNVKDSTIEASFAHPLFELRFPYGQYHAYDVAPDGQQFLVNALIPPTGKPVVAH